MTANATHLDIPPRRLLFEISAETGIPESTILSRRRTPRVAEARQILMLLAYHHGRGLYSLTAVGKLLNRDHATILYACRILDARLKAGDPALRLKIDNILARCCPPASDYQI